MEEDLGRLPLVPPSIEGLNNTSTRVPVEVMDFGSFSTVVTLPRETFEQMLAEVTMTYGFRVKLVMTPEAIDIMDTSITVYRLMVQIEDDCDQN